MDEKGRPSLFNDDEFSKGYISLNLTDNEVIALITSLQYAYRMYKLTEKIMREQGHEKEADVAKQSADMAMDMANKITMDADPGYPESSIEFM